MTYAVFGSPVGAIVVIASAYGVVLAFANFSIGADFSVSL